MIPSWKSTTVQMRHNPWSMRRHSPSIESISLAKSSSGIRVVKNGINTTCTTGECCGVIRDGGHFHESLSLLVWVVHRSVRGPWCLRTQQAGQSRLSATRCQPTRTMIVPSQKDRELLRSAPVMHQRWKQIYVVAVYRMYSRNTKSRLSVGGPRKRLLKRRCGSSPMTMMLYMKSRFAIEVTRSIAHVGAGCTTCRIWSTRVCRTNRLWECQEWMLISLAAVRRKKRYSWF